MRKNRSRFAKQIFSKDGFVAFICTLSSGLICFYFATGDDSSFVNYREMNQMVHGVLTLCAVILFYALGIYGSAWFLMLFRPRRMPTFEPALLMVGGVIGGLLGLLTAVSLGPSLFIQLNILSLKILGVPTFNRIRSGGWPALLLIMVCGAIISMIGIRLACWFKFPRSAGAVASGMRASIPIVLILCLYWLHYSGFPSVNASAQKRQAWGYGTFSSYGSIVDYVKACKDITEKVGDIEFVSPTAGGNFFVQTDNPGTSSYRIEREFTLEVVGTAGTGVAKLPKKGDNTFTHQKGKEEKLFCE